MELTLVALVLLALASYRLTRLIVIDEIFSEPRTWILSKVGVNHFVNAKIVYLFSCTWCTGIWVSAFVYWLYTDNFVFLDVAAIAGLQGFLHALEPDE